MTSRIAHPILEQTSPIIKPQSNTQPPLLPNSMIHHNSSSHKLQILYRIRKRNRNKLYGVSSSRRVLTPGLFLKKYDYIQQGLRVVLGLSPCQREVTMRLLRWWAYYGKVYPKAATIVGEYRLTDKQVDWRSREGIEKLPRRGEIGRATFWRTIALLEKLGLIQVVNRFLFHPHAQISNLYRLDKLVIMIIRYLAEHGGHIWPKDLDRLILMPWRQFWASVSSWDGTLYRNCAYPPFL